MKRLFWHPHTTKEQHLRRLRDRMTALHVDDETWERLEPAKLNRYQLEALFELVDKSYLHGMRTQRDQP